MAGPTDRGPDEDDVVTRLPLKAKPAARRVDVRPEDIRLGERGPHRPDSLNKVVVAFIAMAAIITACGLLVLTVVVLATRWLQVGS